MDMDNIGIVVIGRNEGERLCECLKSINDGTSCPVIYVDSGSIDTSVAVARSFGAEVLELDSRQPFSAARARNEGYARLIELHPSVQFIQFVDGDCTLMTGWLDAARSALVMDSKRAAVIGHLQERNREATPYNRLCALEWHSPPGDLTNFGSFGGLSMIRVDVLRKLGGFNPNVIAGEDSEFGVRMGLAGYKVTKIDQPMATHDANITTFMQWWIRAVRAGHAIGQRSQLNGKTVLRDCVRERTSTLLWGIGLPLTVLVTLIPSNGLSVLLLGGYLTLYYRVRRYRRGQGDSHRDASLYAKFLLLAKFANGVGLIKFYLNSTVHRYEIIEYK
jgi:glycosyltransferase involved in cell wall biosynthesis